MNAFHNNDDTQSRMGSHPLNNRTMKKNTISLSALRRSWLAVTALAGSLLLSAVTAPTANAADGNPPDRISYKGFLVDASGDPLEPTAPRNHTIVFRIYEVLLGGAPLWSEQQTVTIDNGVFSVLLGAGTEVGSESHNLLHTVFQGSNASDRYVGITVDGGTELAPRMRFLTSPYAQLARNAVTANSLNGGVVNTVAGGGIVVEDSVAVPVPRAGTWNPSYREVLKATQGIWDWNVLMNMDNGDLVWADANATTGSINGPEEMILNGAGDLSLRGTVGPRGGLRVVDGTGIPSPSVGTFHPSLRRVYSATQGAFQWHAMMNNGNGDLVWANNNADDGHEEMYLSPTGHLNVRSAVFADGIVARNSGLLVQNASHTPLARSGVFSGNAKRIYSATVGHRDWHVFFNADDGNLLWSDGNVDGDAHSEMYLTPAGRLNIEDGIAINNATTAPPLYPNDWKGVLSAGVGGKTWHIMMDNAGAGNLIFGDDVEGAYEMFLGRGSGHLHVKGSVFATSYESNSDRRLKKNIQDSGSGMLEKVSALRPVTYNWKRQGDNEPKDFGLIAQEVREVFPEIVSHSNNPNSTLGNTLAISYGKLGVLAVGAIKELHAETKREDSLLHEEVKSLREENSSLNDQLREMQSRLEVLEQNLL